MREKERLEEGEGGGGWLKVEIGGRWREVDLENVGILWSYVCVVWDEGVLVVAMCPATLRETDKVWMG